MSRLVLKTILDWSINRPVWQRDALRRIIAKGTLNSDDIKELIELCKHGIGSDETIVNAQYLEESHLPSTPKDNASITLSSISNIQNANDLAINQTLNFEPKGITVIYGDNGVGKSGYVRILKRTCRARHAGEILPNIYLPEDIKEKASATFHFHIGQIEQPQEKWEDSDRPHKILSAISVFDTDCADIHINKENEIAFRPFGLDIPDELVNVCQHIKDILASEKKQIEEQNSFIINKPFWKNHTKVGLALIKLSRNTNVQNLINLSTLSEEEQTRFNQLKKDLTNDPTKSAAEIKLKADNVKRLNDLLNSINETTSADFLTQIFSLKKELDEKQISMRLAAEGAFSSGSLKGIGSESWRLLWEASRKYSQQVAYPHSPFPPTEDDFLCVLCQQPLAPDARERMNKFEKFILNDLTQEMEETENTLNCLLNKLKLLKINTSSIKNLLDELSLQDINTTKNIIRYLASARLRRYCFLKIPPDAKLLSIPPLSPLPTEILSKIEVRLRNYGNELFNATIKENRVKLDNEFDELNDKINLNNNLDEIQNCIERLKKIDFINKCISTTSTTDITKLGNQIADTVITPILRDRFQEEVVKLAAERVRVEMVRSGGRYGASQYQVKLLAKPKAKINTILSEGEQTCVAFAAFLSELATASHNSALVFDDPVSSLDHRWRNKIAHRLIDESKNRQIIIFTHDLVFVNDIYDLADKQNIPIKAQTLNIGAAGKGIVTEGLPWKGQKIKDRLDKLEKLVREAEKYYHNNEETQYHNEVTDIYNKLRATWERALEEVGFARVILRYRDYINTSDLKKVVVLTGKDCELFESGFKKCCDITSAHDPSCGRNAEIPAPTEVKQDIQNLKTWANDLKERQKIIK